MSLAQSHPIAVKAHKLRSTGLGNKAIGEKLKVSTPAASNLCAIGHHVAEIDGARLTDSEILLLRCIAKVHRRLLSEGQVRCPESKEIARAAGRGTGWPVATGRKRLHGTATWNPVVKQYEVSGLYLINISGNGYVNLMPLGWMFVHAIEAAEQAVKP